MSMAKVTGPVRITSVSFQHYKGLGRYSLSLDHVNVLTGANNSGKSTIVGAFRVLAVAMRTARSRKPERISLNDRHFLGYLVKGSFVEFTVNFYAIAKFNLPQWNRILAR